jgi:UDP-N-acetyl-D-glucosamine dehydrogenase
MSLSASSEIDCGLAGHMKLTELQPTSRILSERIKSRTATAGVIGLGYVGVPLAAAIARAGFKVIGFDVDESKLPLLNAGKSYIGAVKSEELAKLVASGHFRATAEMAQLASCDVIIICVPTPLTRQREPDMTYVVTTAHTIAQYLRPGQLVVLESTTYPGSTQEILRPILETSELKAGEDFFVGFSPEREDPGNDEFETVTIPKIVAGDGPDASLLMQAFYGAVVARVVPVSTPAVAEAVKITENLFRAVNIALVNEMKVIYHAMGIDIWEVIDAAKTKPFGFMPFYPGPGLGGHCIPIDPFYLTWKSREFDLQTRFIELAGEINRSMPRYVLSRIEEALDDQLHISLSRARILLVGIAYKKNVSDVRESPAFKIMELIEKRGSICHFSDPHVPVIPPTREHPEFTSRESVNLTAEIIATYDAIVIVTDHDAIDYRLIGDAARLIVDTRNVFVRRGIHGPNVVKA